MKDPIRKFQPTILVIMETHIAFNRTKAFWFGVGYCPVQVVEANGYSGGLWILKQNGCNVTVLILDVHPHVIYFKLELGGNVWAYSCIYASPIPTNRPVLWQHLKDLRASITGP